MPPTHIGGKMKVQRYRVLLNLRGDATIQLPKDVTPAEIAVLRAVHGSKDAVTRGYRLDIVDLDPDEEYDRLVRTYGRAAVDEAHVTPANACAARARGLVVITGHEVVEADEMGETDIDVSAENLGDAFDRAAA